MASFIKHDISKSTLNLNMTVNRRFIFLMLFKLPSTYPIYLLHFSKIFHSILLNSLSKAHSKAEASHYLKTLIIT